MRFGSCKLETDKDYLTWIFLWIELLLNSWIICCSRLHVEVRKAIFMIIDILEPIGPPKFKEDYKNGMGFDSILTTFFDWDKVKGMEVQKLECKSIWLSCSEITLSWVHHIITCFIFLWLKDLALSLPWQSIAIFFFDFFFIFACLWGINWVLHVTFILAIKKEKINSIFQTKYMRRSIFNPVSKRFFCLSVHF